MNSAEYLKHIKALHDGYVGHGEVSITPSNTCVDIRVMMPDLKLSFNDYPALRDKIRNTLEGERIPLALQNTIKKAIRDYLSELRTEVLESNNTIVAKIADNTKESLTIIDILTMD